MQQENKYLSAQILALVRDNKLACADAHKLACEAGVEPRIVGQAAQALGIKISDCQLDCFGRYKEN